MPHALAPSLEPQGHTSVEVLDHLEGRSTREHANRVDAEIVSGSIDGSGSLDSSSYDQDQI